MTEIDYNKNAFQSKAHLSLANRKSNTYKLALEWPWPWYHLDLIFALDLRQVKPSETEFQVAKLVFSMRWPWTWSNNLDTQTGPIYCQDVPPHQKWSFFVNWFKSYSLNRCTQTDRHIDTTKTLPLPHTREVKTTLSPQQHHRLNILLIWWTLRLNNFYYVRYLLIWSVGAKTEGRAFLLANSGKSHVTWHNNWPNISCPVVSMWHVVWYLPELAITSKIMRPSHCKKD